MADPGHGEARRYLEEVMGIVEDEEFSSQQRLRRLRALKQRRPQAQARAAGSDCNDCQDQEDEASGCVKVESIEHNAVHCDIVRASQF